MWPELCFDGAAIYGVRDKSFTTNERGKSAARSWLQLGQ
jgi:hypothetical protein